MTDPTAAVLDAVDALQGTMVPLIGAIVSVPSISGTDAENEAQAHLAGILAGAGFDVDHWHRHLRHRLSPARVS